ncbi:MAG: ABC transporter ATP-binding protein [Alphaproteobacteria bacterium]|nr:ABC transporter ATP-binding protein [Alphaproteobacteria bacterium]
MTQSTLSSNTQNSSPQSSHDALTIKNLYKTYHAKKNSKQALKDVSLNIPKGSVFGLLGPNGAGKSTLINILAQLVTKTSGQVKVWDYDLDTNPRMVAASIGIVPQELNMDPFFTPRELLDLQAGLYGVPARKRQTDEILKTLSLSKQADAYARTLSGGMRRRLMVGKAMVHNPPILVLDEPTAGVDIELRQQLWDHVRNLNKAGVTVLLTTHYLEEAQELCDYIAIINHGQVIAYENTKTLLQHIDRKQILIKTTNPLVSIPEQLKKFDAQIEHSGQLRLSYRPSEIRFDSILNLLTQINIDIEDLVTIETDLEDIFLKLTRENNQTYQAV